MILLAGANGASAAETETPVTSEADADPSVEVYSQGTPDGIISPAKLGRMPLHFAVGLDFGYESNSGSARDQGDSFFTALTVGATYSFHGERWDGSIATDTAFNYYFERDVDPFRPDAHLNLNLSYAVSDRMSLALALAGGYQSQPDFSLYGTSVAHDVSFWHSADSLSLSYQWLPRISTVTSYNFGFVSYNDAGDIDTRDYVQNGGRQEFRFLLLPLTTLTAEYRIDAVSYSSGGGDSLSQSALLGIDQTMGPHLHGILKAGVQIYSSDGNSFVFSSPRRMPHIDSVSPQVEGSLSYNLGERTVLTWTGSYAIEPSSDVATAGEQTFRTGLSSSYGLSRLISLSATVFYVHEQTSDNGAAAFSDNGIDVTLGVAYAVRTYASITANYEYIESDSDAANRSYSRNRYLLGLRLTF